MERHIIHEPWLHTHLFLYHVHDEISQYNDGLYHAFMLYVT